MEIIRERKRRHQELSAEALGLDPTTRARGTLGPRVFKKQVDGLLDNSRLVGQPSNPNMAATQNPATLAPYFTADVSAADGGDVIQ